MNTMCGSLLVIAALVLGPVSSVSSTSRIEELQLTCLVRPDALPSSEKPEAVEGRGGQWFALEEVSSSGAGAGEVCRGGQSEQSCAIDPNG